jgi:hypothetical protein
MITPAPKFDICFQTRAASRNKYVTAVGEILFRHGIRQIGQYRGDNHYAIYTNEAVPDSVVTEIRSAAPAAKIRQRTEP